MSDHTCIGIGGGLAGERSRCTHPRTRGHHWSMRTICAFSSFLSPSDLSPCHLLLRPRAAPALPLPVPPERPEAVSPAIVNKLLSLSPPPPLSPARAPAPVASNNGQSRGGRVGWSACPARPAYRRVSGVRGMGSWSTEREHCGIIHY